MPATAPCSKYKPDIEFSSNPQSYITKVSENIVTTYTSCLEACTTECAQSDINNSCVPNCVSKCTDADCTKCVNNAGQNGEKVKNCVEGGGLGTGIKILIVIAICTVICIAIGLYIWRRRNSKQEKKSSMLSRDNSYVYDDY